MRIVQSSSCRAPRDANRQSGSEPVRALAKVEAQRLRGKKGGDRKARNTSCPGPFRSPDLPIF
jgi:hypothetical protein